MTVEILLKKDCNIQQENGLQSNKNFSLLKIRSIKKEPLKFVFNDSLLSMCKSLCVLCFEGCQLFC